MKYKWFEIREKIIKAGFLTTINWIFGVICASIVLIIVLRRAL